MMGRGEHTFLDLNALPLHFTLEIGLNNESQQAANKVWLHPSLTSQNDPH